MDKIHVVEGYTFLVAQSIDELDLPQFVSVVFSAFGAIDLDSCEANMALGLLKMIFAVGRTLYTTSPGKLSSGAWTTGRGREITEWVRRTVATFLGRFPEDFEVIEVGPFLYSAYGRSSRILFSTLLGMWEDCWVFHLTRFPSCF